MDDGWILAALLRPALPSSISIARLFRSVAVPPVVVLPTGAPADPAAAGDPAAAAGGDPELEALLGGGGAAPAAPPAPGGAPGGAAPPAPGGPIMQGKERGKKAIAEGVPPWQAGHGNPKERPWRDDHPSEYEDDPDFKEMTRKELEEKGEDTSHLDEGTDPYAVKKGEEIATEGLRFTDYGAPVITDDGDLDRIVRIMRRLATEHKLTGKALSENLENMAKASIKAIGLRVAVGKLGKAVEEAVCSLRRRMGEALAQEEQEEGRRGQGRG
jgi:hypothetical protein